MRAATTFQKWQVAATPTTRVAMSAPAPAPAPAAPAKDPVDAADLLEARTEDHNTSRPPHPFFSRPGPSNATCGADDVCSRYCARPHKSSRTQEDDEFEEFEQQEWTAAAEDVQDPDMWQDGWEDDEDDTDFTAQLRAELAATEGTAPPTVVAPQTAMEQ